MDQTNSKFGSGGRTINMRMGTNNSKHCTVALTMSAFGEMLMPIVVYKGARNDHIASHKIPNHPQGMVYVMQLKAWFDEVTMLDWV